MFSPKQLGQSSIRVLGSRSAGKTTFMATLARYPNVRNDSPIESIIPISDDSVKLIENAQNILEQGLQLEPTPLTDIDSVKDYHLRIALKKSFWTKFGNETVSYIDINCKDYPGEFIESLSNKIENETINDYVNDCLNSTGILLLVDGTSRRNDMVAQGLKNLLSLLDQASLNKSVKKIALAITKCEQPELWINRHNVLTICKATCPLVLNYLQNWQNISGGVFEVFATSAFGTMGQTIPVPNFKKISKSSGGITAVIKRPDVWRPFGLVAPVYWLATGHKRSDLED